jgi:two-component system phosphate regulon sensor histidine kinase PhoR
MAPAVPFALLGVVQLLAVAGWLGLAGAATFPRLRRRVTPVFVAGALVMAAADATTALQLGSRESTALGWLRLAGLLLLALGALGGSGQSLAMRLPAGAAPAVVVPLGASPGAAYAGGVAGLFAAAAAYTRGRRPAADRWLGLALAAAFGLTGVAAALAGPARDSTAVAIVLLSVRAAATLAVGVALVVLARANLIGKLAGAILAGVVAMAAGAVGVVGTGVASQVQQQQEQRLLQVAHGGQQTLTALSTRAALYADVVVAYPQDKARSAQFLRLFSEQPDYFGAVVDRTGAVVVAAIPPLTNVALLQLSGSAVVRAAMSPNTPANTPAGDALILPGNPPRLVLVEAVPGRPNGTSDARVKPTYAGVYGVGVVDAYLRPLSRQIGYDVSIVAGGQVIASSLPPSSRAAITTEARAAHVDALDPSVDRVVPAEGDAPTVAFVAVDLNQAGGDVRVATLAISQPAGEALSAQRSVLRRMFVTALLALLLVVLLAIVLARRIADPIRRLTVAAGRVRRGDLDAATQVRSHDEVGQLARAFDAMTASLRSATGDLRAAAEQEAALRARLETVVESMTDGLVVVDGKDRVTAINATALSLLGIGADDAVGKKLRDVLDVVDGEGRSVLSSRQVVDGRLTSAAGREVPVRLGVAPLSGGEGRVLVVSDRTREVDIERIKSEFLANVSHELRTPLTPIRGYAELLARRSDLSAEQRGGFVDEILNSTARMSRVVELLVDVAALEAGRVAAEQSKTSVRTLVEQRVTAWRASYPGRAADIKRRVGSRLPAVYADPRWVNRALDEFADNAVKYTPPGTAITLTAAVTDDGRFVRVAVRDQGPGFDPRIAAELVGDFSQADASETRRVGGMGLGLGFVSRVATRFGLPFTVDAEPGKGAEFGLLLPVWSPPER